MNQPYNTNEEFKTVLKNCRDLFAKKLHDYGAAWRILRPASVTDQLYIKVNRIRSIEMKVDHVELKDLPDSEEELWAKIKKRDDERIYAIAECFRRGVTVDEIYELLN